jgi:hypothetical protein
MSNLSEKPHRFKPKKGAGPPGGFHELDDNDGENGGDLSRAEEPGLADAT